MRGRWFRKYESTMDDPKVQLLSDWHYRAWDTLLCFASKCGGEFTDAIQTLAFVLRKPEGKARDTMQVLLSAGLMEKTENGYKPHNWDEFQYKSDTSKERVAAFRERTKTVTCNVTETPDVTPPDTEADTESETEADTESETERKITPTPRKRASKPALVEPEGFAEFWQAYPDSRARLDALKAYIQALPKTTPQHLVAAAKRYASEVRGEPKKFIKLAGGWLRDERWRDADGAKVIRIDAFNSGEEAENQQRLREKYGQA